MDAVDFLNLTGLIVILFGSMLLLWFKRQSLALDRKHGVDSERG